MLGKNVIENLSSDEILESLGLMRKSEERSWLWPALGGLGLGLLCGVALGVAFAPKKGSELREDLAGKLKSREFGGMGESARGTLNQPGTQAYGTTPGRGSTVI